ESEDEVRPGGKRGPKSQTRDHFWPPVAVNANSEKRWSFKCRHCKHAFTFKRTVGKDQLFGDEKPAPALGNLATHYRQHHHGVPVPSDVQPGETRSISASSAKIMADFLVEGKLNPAINSTQKNFLKVFSAWIIEDDLPFTTVPLIICIHLLSIEIRLTNFLYLLAVALDNAAPNDILLRALARLLMEKFDIQFIPANSQIHCLAHVVNIMFTKVTKQMSHSSTPTLPWVLPMYKGMCKHLQASEGNAKFGCLRMAAAAGLEKLEFYYSKASDSQLNIIAT
ncbi:hypothetical protein DFH07DRAFT_682224, partial [Mycena maculata]